MVGNTTKRSGSRASRRRRRVRGNGSRGIPRERLLGVAAELFARQGYRATSLDDVAAALQIKKASLYHYIDSKEELLNGIYDKIMNRIEAAVAPVAGSSLPPEERLRRMVFAHIEVVACESAMLAVLFQEEAELTHPHLVVIRRRMRAHERLFEGVIEEGVATGVLRPLTSRLMVRALLGMCNWMYQWYRPERHSWEQIASEFALLLESGWLSDGDPRQGVWARPESVEEALGPAREIARQARADLDELSVEITRAEDRLRDGLARPI